MCNYRNEYKPLKIEVSYRNPTGITDDDTNIINNIRVYDISTLAVQKAIAYAGRDTIRDLYDLVFICDKYIEELSEDTKGFIKGVFIAKGLEHFDYVMNTQEDSLIDKKALANSFLLVWDKFGLLDNEEERDMLELGKE